MAGDDHYPKSWDVGWFPDPGHPGQERFWNGSAWTRNREAPDPAAAVPDADVERPRWLWLLLGGLVVVAVVIVVMAIALIDSGPLIEEDDRAEFDEVSITSCDRPGTPGVQQVRGVVENGSSQTSDYAIELSVISADGTRIGTGETRVEAVESGQTAVWSSETDADEQDWDQGTTCRVTGVERTLAR